VASILSCVEARRVIGVISLSSAVLVILYGLDWGLGIYPVGGIFVVSDGDVLS